MIHCSTSDMTTYFVSRDLIKALVGRFQGGYAVRLHDLPGRTFVVDAPSVDQAHQWCLSLAQRDGRCRLITGATVLARTD
jgi:hypothetical protein